MVFPTLSALFTGTVWNFLGYIVPRPWPDNTDEFHELFISLNAPGKLRGFSLHLNFYKIEGEFVSNNSNLHSNDVGKCRLFIAVIMYSSFQLLTFSNLTEDGQVS